MDGERTRDTILERLEKIDRTSSIGSEAGASYLYPQYKGNLLGFVAEVLGCKTWNPDFDHKAGMWEGQRAVFRSTEKFKYTWVYSSRGTGKDFLAARLILAYFFTRPCRILCLAPSMRQLQEVLFSEISKAFHGATQKLSGELQTMKLKMPGDARHYILGIPAGDPDRARGFHSDPPGVPGDPDAMEMTAYDWEQIKKLIEEGQQEADEVLIVIDEPEGIKQEVFQVLEGTMSKPGTRMLNIGNPSLGLWEDHNYVKALRGNDENTNRINLSSLPHSDFPGQNEEQLAMFDEIYDNVGYWLIPQDARDKATREFDPQDPIFLSDLRGLCSESALGAQVIPYTAMQLGLKRYKVNTSRHRIGPRIGIDLGFGGDPSVVTMGNNGVVRATFSWRSASDDHAMQVTMAETIMEVAEQWGAQCAKNWPESWEGGAVDGDRMSIDCTGMPGVADFMSSMGMECDRVNFGGAHERDQTEMVDFRFRMKNARAGLYWHARMGLQDGLYCVPKIDRFSKYWEEVPWTNYTREFDVVQLEKKEATIKRHGHSPDFGDSFVLFARPTRGDRLMWTTGGKVLSDSLLGKGDLRTGRPQRRRRDPRQWSKVAF